MSAGSQRTAILPYFCIVRLASFLAGDNVFEEDEKKRIYISKASNILEALGNLTYLIRKDADHPEKINYYANMCEERLAAFRRMLVDNGR
jgi:hypothetical protein